ncbi:MAG TPA: TonB-dependent receptor [Longimicrobium sp.]|nr:TonB-dependent receptor [Longimicrobium sp.]
MRYAFLFLAAVLAASAAPLQAQVRLDGVVRDDSTGAAIPQARVEVTGPYFQRIGARAADSLGTFRFNLRRFGEYRVKVSAPGYADVDAPFRTEAFVYSSVEVRLQPHGELATPLAFLARTQLMPSPALDGYYARQRWGRGAFFTRMHVELVRPGYITDLIATAPGIEQQRAGLDGEHRTLLTRGTGCPLRVYVDGEPLELTPSTGEAGPSALDGSVDQTMVEGIEVYVDPAALPPELGGGTESCGAVAVWTKRLG